MVKVFDPTCASYVEEGSCCPQDDGSEGQIIRIIGGVPTWVTPSTVVPVEDEMGGSVAVPRGNGDLVVTFASPMPDNTYALTTSLRNEVDNNAPSYGWNIVEKTAAGFTVSFSGPIVRDNYWLEYEAKDF